MIGAQAQGFNSQTTGIANIGTFTDVPQTQVALEAIAKLIRWKLPLSGAPDGRRRRAHERGRQHQPLPGRHRRD